jgi:capsular exopolysaccharide synthesis family protein
MRNDHVTLRSTAVFDLLAPRTPAVPVKVELRYDTRDPYAVVAAFRTGRAGWVEWVFARDLLADGLLADAGDGDVRIRPSIEDPEAVLVELNSPSGHAMFETSAQELADFLDRRLKSSEDFERTFGWPVLVTIPRGAVPELSDGDLAGVKGEPYRMLREGLRFLDITVEHRCLLVTSPDAGEGKTTVAVNLARALIAGGERVILIDADLRRPAAGRQLGLEDPAYGLSTALVSSPPLSDVLVDVEPRGSLRLLPTGPTPPNPADLLRTRRMYDLLDEARSMVDVVIVDAAPLLPVSDTRALLDLPNVDGVLMVARAFSTRRDRATAARRVLEQSERPVLGVVLTGSRDAAGDYRYYGGYVDNGRGRKRRQARVETADID